MASWLHGTWQTNMKVLYCVWRALDKEWNGCQWNKICNFFLLIQKGGIKNHFWLLVCWKDVNVLLIFIIENSPRKFVWSRLISILATNTTLRCVCYKRYDRTKRDWTNFLWHFSMMRMKRVFASFQQTSNRKQFFVPPSEWDKKNCYFYLINISLVITIQCMSNTKTYQFGFQSKLTVKVKQKLLTLTMAICSIPSKTDL